GVRGGAALASPTAGQVCISPTRFLVHKSVAGDFAQALTAHAKGLKVGDGLTEGTQMGPLANPRRIDAMTQFTEGAVEKAAKLFTAGQRTGAAATFGQPRIVSDVPREVRIFNAEPFGPV